MMDCKLFFLRHGETDENLTGQYHGRTEAPLNSKGRKQLEDVVPLLRSKGSLLTFSSPQQRCRDCSEIIYDGRNEITFADELMEFDFGVFEGKGYNALSKEYPEAMEKWEKDWRNYRIPEGEGVADIYERTIAYIEQCMRNYPGCNLLFVTHWGVIQSALAWLMYGSIEGFWKFELQNGSLSSVWVRESGNILCALNEKTTPDLMQSLS